MVTKATSPMVDPLQTVNYADASVTAAKLAATLDLSGKTLTLPTTNTPALTKSFVSSAQTITAAGLLTLAHGLGVVPKLIRTSLVCQTGEFGWSAADEALVDIVSCDGTRQSAIYWDATNVYIRQSLDASLCTVANKTTGAVSAITNANWKLVVRAFA